MSNKFEAALADLLLNQSDIYEELYWWSKEGFSKGKIRVKIPSDWLQWNKTDSHVIFTKEHLWDSINYQGLSFSYVLNSLTNLTKNFPIEEQFPNLLIFDLDEMEMNFYDGTSKLNLNPAENFLDKLYQEIYFKVPRNELPEEIEVEFKLLNPNGEHRKYLEDYFSNRSQRLLEINQRISYHFRLVTARKDLHKELLKLGLNEVKNLNEDDTWKYFNNLYTFPLVGNDIIEQFLFFEELKKSAKIPLADFKKYHKLIKSIIVP